jgi:uncharacterized protein YaaQ
MSESTASEGGLPGKTPDRQSLRLVVAIVQEEDADPVCEDLIRSDLPVTKIASTGGFLRRGNATLLIGVGSEGLDRVKEIVQARCVKREVPVSATVEDTAEAGGAVVFVVTLDELVKF